MENEPSKKPDTSQRPRVFVAKRPDGVSDEVWLSMAEDIIEAAATAYVENQRLDVLAGNEDHLRQVTSIYSGKQHPVETDPEFLERLETGVAQGDQTYMFLAVGLRALQKIRESNPFQ